PSPASNAHFFSARSAVDADASGDGDATQSAARAAAATTARADDDQLIAFLRIVGARSSQESKRSSGSAANAAHVAQESRRRRYFRWSLASGTSVYVPPFFSAIDLSRRRSMPMSPNVMVWVFTRE